MWNRFKKYVFNSEILEEPSVKNDEEDSSVIDSDDDLGEDVELNYKTINWNYVFKVDNYLETLTIYDREALDTIRSAAETSNYSGPFIAMLPQTTCPPPPGSFLPSYTPFGGIDTFAGLKKTVRNIIIDKSSPVVERYDENVNNGNICNNFVELCIQWDADITGYSTKILRFDHITPNELHTKTETCCELFRKIGIIYHLIDYMHRHNLGMFSLQKSMTLLDKTIQIKKMIIRSGTMVPGARDTYSTRYNKIICEKEYSTKISLQGCSEYDILDISYNFVNQPLDA
tara:strand:- start:12169 stop:13026 length:858 start_codon:yes stop_codon:yes gene_type:complete